MAPPRQRVTLRIIDVKGLYLPGYPDSSSPVAGRRRAAGYKPGYKSLDGQGRIYVDHDIEGRWKRNTQLVEVTVEITASGELPADARIRWSAVDPDDPLNERPAVSRAAGVTIDPGDHDEAGTYVAPVADDNEGTRDGSAAWEEAEGYTIFEATEASATTAIVSGISRVRHHTTDIAGDNLIVRAELATETPVDASGDATGIMTLWHQIDVEYVRMESALPLPVEEAPRHFEPAFVQLDFAAERVIPDLEYMAPDKDTLGESSSRFVDEAFSHETDPGWFCVISALEPYPLPDVKGVVLFTGTVTIEDSGEGAQRAEHIEIPGSYPDADLVKLRWGAHAVSFQVAIATVIEGPPLRTQLVLEPHDVQNRFTAGDGSIAHAYARRLFFFPRARRRDGAWEPGGYGVPDRVEAEVRSAGAFYTAGISPTIDLGQMRYFAGRTLLFTHHRAWWDAARGEARPGYRQGTLRTMIHELVHGLGMPHKCGYFDYRTPPRTTCCMNYGPNWMIDANEELIPGTSGLVGHDLCGRHLKEIRRVHLGDNKGLRWK